MTNAQAFASILTDTVVNGVYYDALTPRAVIDVLDRARNAIAGPYRIRLFYGDTATGRQWGEENDVTGIVGASMGQHRVPLLLHNARSVSGHPILCHCIVGILSGNVWLYRHPSLDLGQWTIKGEPPDDLPDYEAEVYRDGELYARCKDVAQARRLAAFMRGERMCK